MVGGLPFILVLYVDDLILNGYESLIQDWKEDLEKEFEMKNMGLVHYFLGLEVWQGDGDGDSFSRNFICKIASAWPHL